MFVVHFVYVISTINIILLCLERNPSHTYVKTYKNIAKTCLSKFDM